MSRITTTTETTTTSSTSYINTVYNYLEKISKPYMREINITIDGWNFNPYQHVIVYFDGTMVYCTPDTSTFTTYGELDGTIKCNSRGGFRAVFKVPANVQCGVKNILTTGLSDWVVQFEKVRGSVKDPSNNDSNYDGNFDLNDDGVIDKEDWNLIYNKYGDEIEITMTEANISYEGRSWIQPIDVVSWYQTTVDVHTTIINTIYPTPSSGGGDGGDGGDDWDYGYDYDDNEDTPSPEGPGSDGPESDTSDDNDSGSEDQDDGGWDGGDFRCFPAGSLVTMYDGSYENIEDIKINDVVLTYDFINKKNTITIVNLLYNHNRDHMCTILFESGKKLKLTTEHPVMTDIGWSSIDPKDTLENHNLNVSELIVGSNVFREDGSYDKIIDIVIEKGTYMTYTLPKLSNGYKYFYVDGVLTHNKTH